MKKWIVIFCLLVVSPAFAADTALNGFTNITESTLTASDELVVWNSGGVKNITVENLWDWYELQTGFPDVTGIGDCTGGDCFDGTTDGGSYLKFANSTGTFWISLGADEATANRHWRLPNDALPAAGSVSVIYSDEYGNWNLAATASTAEMRAGTETAIRAMTPSGIFQAVDAWMSVGHTLILDYAAGFDPSATDYKFGYDSTSNTLRMGDEDGASYKTWAPLDDTATNGDTMKVWSADKVYDQLALKAPLSSPTLTTPNIGAATGTSLSLSGNLTGLTPPVVLTHASGVHDGSNDAAIMTDSGESFTANAMVGMTLYNVTDASSCTVTANDGTTITCTLAGGTDNNWDTNDVWQIGPGPNQSGSAFYVSLASTIRHPATAGYQAAYYVDGTVTLTIEVADAMTIVGATASAIDAGDTIDSPSTAGSFICLHNKSATSANTWGKNGTWTDGGAS